MIEDAKLITEFKCLGKGFIEINTEFIVAGVKHSRKTTLNTSNLEVVQIGSSDQIKFNVSTLGRSDFMFVDLPQDKAEELYYLIVNKGKSPKKVKIKPKPKPKPKPKQKPKVRTGKVRPA